MGKAYILIAGLYADSANDCGNNQFENKQYTGWPHKLRGERQ